MLELNCRIVTLQQLSLTTLNQTFSEGVLTQHHFQLKETYAFWPFIYKTTVFWGSEDWNFWKRISNCKSFSKTQKCKFVKMMTSCTCITYLHGFFKSVIANYWPGMHNTEFKGIFADPCKKKKIDLSKNARKNFSIFIMLSCKLTLSVALSVQILFAPHTYRVSSWYSTKNA